ncbi:MAG: T9SS type A sorting domain-containing protein [Taibaiella sp.]|nr:T9SS type A sorting domain-containing protein [Taibaiella sp.]
MKKAIIFLMGLFASVLSQAQSIDNAGMEDWRTTSVFGLPPTSIQTPKMWFCTDSLALAVGPFALDTSGAPFNRQIFRESSIKRTGSYAAKLMTAMEGDLGYFPGFLSNAKISVDPTAMGITFDGGQAVTVQPNTVSAWVVYKPGIDTTTDTIGYDEGLMTVMAIATIGVVDSMVGVGFVNITPSDTDTFSQVTATLSYTTTDYPVHTLRILFASSADPSAALDSSTLYVDDLSMTSSPNPPPPVSVADLAMTEVVRLFPNPAHGELNIRGDERRKLTMNLITSTGQLVKSTPVTGNSKIDVSTLASGVYLYSITDATGRKTQDGSVTVTH